MGTTEDVAPMATPIRARPRIKAATLGDHSSNIDDVKNRMLARRIVPRRPADSENLEAATVPTMDPTVDAVTMIPCTNGRDANPNSGMINKSAPPTEPVS
jgi:hypothetical protein